MSARTQSIGKLFISHSSRDKPFVRRLEKQLASKGYTCWLDEKELLPGHALATALSDALKRSRVVLVVITEHSLKSKWLSFELNKATERMVRGKCRLIPVLKGDVDPPAELQAIVFSDFRKSFAKGLHTLLKAVDEEADKVVRETWRELTALTEETFDSHGFASGDLGYESIDYSFVCIKGLQDPSRPNDEASIVLDVIHDYSHRRDPLTNNWWEDYKRVQERYGEAYHLVVSERPVRIAGLSESRASPRVKYYFENHSITPPFVVVFADLSDLIGQASKPAVLGSAKEELKRIGLILKGNSPEWP